MIVLTAAMLMIASGEPPIGSRLGSRKDIAVAYDDNRAVLAGHAVAGCMYLKRRANVRAVLNALTQQEAARQVAKSWPQGTCINLRTANEDADEQSVRAPLAIMRGMLAEVVIREESLGKTLTALPPKRDYAYPWFAATGRPTDMDEMAICVAETNPNGVAGYAQYHADLCGRGAAVTALNRSIGNCLAAGVKLVGNRQSLRAALADAYYHRAVAPAPTAPPE